MEFVVALVMAGAQDDPSDATRDLLDVGLTEYMRAEAAGEKGDRAQEKIHFGNSVGAFEKAIQSGPGSDLCCAWLKRSGEYIFYRMAACSDGRIRDMAQKFLFLAHGGSPLSVRRIVELGDEGELERTALVCDSFCFFILEFALDHPRWWRARLLLEAEPVHWGSRPKYRRAVGPDE